MAADTLSFLAPLALQEGIEIGLDRPESGVAIIGNPDLVGDLIRNLVENAINVSSPGDEVAVVVSADGRIEVHDNGPGISPEHRERVFERFWRLSTTGNRNGSGLGLAIVKEIVGLISAEIDVRDNPEGGTSMHVSFQRA